ncbi:BA14K-like protein [Roseibium hamelinense]|uniref:Lectin-like protein BA14k n=1 Tax=Roseibium hamelinense TaxID=150831 RepID=A0A562SU01_9HYPH|nr:BA14K family protein [Roseibium hamelinense]MTI43176.1 BA14K family protein [Roseibium hamelinense]TWI84775.1 BA14K-like protein [Roseibium hamelinense]
MALFHDFRGKNLGILALALLCAVVGFPVSGEAKNRHHYGGGIYVGSGVGVGVGTGGAYFGYYGGRGYHPPRHYKPRHYRPRHYRPRYYAPRYYPRRVYRAYPFPPPLTIYPPRSRVYVAPGPYVAPRGAVPPTKTGIPPFTPAWYAYCSRKFKSFDPRTGTYLAYSGNVRYCR